MKKILISVVIIVVFGLYVWYQRGQSPAEVSITPTLAPSSTPRVMPSMMPSSGLKDGSYTSAVFDATYGSMQVRITIAGGKMTDGQFLKYPNSPGNTSEISSRTLPILKKEAISAQSAKVDIVSGATQTSEAFIQALGSVLAKAHV